MKKLIVLLLLLFFINNINAQNSEIGIGLGISTYFGDLNTNKFYDDIKQSHPSVEIFYNYFLNPHFNLKIALGHGTISGDDSYSDKDWQKERNLSFSSIITELSGIVEFNILSNDHLIIPFIFSGGNAFYFNPKTLYKGEWVHLQPLGTEGQGSNLYPDRKKYKLVNFSLIFGAGIKFKINQLLTLSIEQGWRRTNTDYLDDVSKEYAGYENLKNTNGELAAILADRTNEYNGFDPLSRIPGTQRGGSKVKDFYTMSFVSLIYSLQDDIFVRKKNKVTCPKF